jgi:VWFA-related protein
MRRAICGLLLALLALGADAQAPTVHTASTEVLVDFVVRDKHSKIVHDIKPEEIQVLEDGIPQTIRHFELVAGHEPGDNAGPTPMAAPVPTVPAPYAAEAPAVRTLRETTIVSVVVGSLNPEGRRASRDAVQQFIKDELRPNTYVGVFYMTYTGMELVQWYTNDGALVSEAMERVVNRTGLRPIYDPDLLPDTVNNATGGPVSGVAADIAMMMETHWMAEYQDTYDKSMRELLAIRDLVQAQAQIPGRKLVFLFAGGLTVHPDTIEVLNSSISAANRSNVTIYSVDTIRDVGQNLAASRRLLAGAAKSSMAQQTGGNGGNRAVTPGQAMALDNADRSIRVDERGNMRELAESTGGALLPVQDLREPFHRAMEDARTHYELAYSPTRSENDGHFRKIEVKVARPAVKVFARSGYYALPLLRGEEIYPFETATLQAINTSPAPKQLDFHSEVLQFRPGSQRTQLTFACEVPVRGLSVTDDKDWAKLHVSITALIKDAQGQVVDKLSKDLPYEVPHAKADELRRGVVSFTTSFRLPPGRYSVETAAVDRDTARAGVRRSVLVVSAPPNGLAVSDLVLVRRVDPAEEPHLLTDPLLLRGDKVTPEVSGVVDRTLSGDLILYGVAYPPTPVQKPVRAALEIRRDGQPIVRSPESELPVEASSAAPFLASFPREKLQPGHYEAILTFRYGDQSARSETTFVVESRESMTQQPSGNPQALPPNP